MKLSEENVQIATRNYGSENGLLVNGERVTEKALDAADEVILGDARLNLKEAMRRLAAKRPE